MKNGSLSFDYPEKNTPKDEFRESLDVTASITLEEQSKFAKKFEQGEKEKSETPLSLPTDLIQ